MTSESQEVLQMYYRKQRATDQRNAARTTLRLLESMIRLAQGMSRQLHDECLLTYQSQRMLN